MIIHETQIFFANEKLSLNNQRTLFWERQKMLVLADLHLGKPAHFRKSGIAIPRQVTIHDLQRLEHLILHYCPERVVIVGDLIHAGANREVDLFKTLTLKFSDTKFLLIKGNHDRLSKDLMIGMGISEIYDNMKFESIFFSHQSPETDIEDPRVVGHVHPGIRIKMATKRIIRLPCFVVTAREIILPAFSRFTGLDTYRIPKDASCFAFSDEGIFEIEHFLNSDVRDN